MTNIGNILLILGVYFIGIGTGGLIEKSKPINKTTIIKPDTTLVNKVEDLEEQNELLLDELQLKESEISYWGRKYEEEKNKKK